MTEHKTGTREEWLAARLELLEAEKELTRRSDELARRRQELPWVRIDKEYRFETDEGSASPGGSLPRDARSSSSTTSCSAPTTRQDAPPARRSRTASTAPSSTWRTTTSRSGRCRGRRSRSCRRTSGGWAGASRGRRRSRATSTTTSMHASRRRSSSRGTVEYNFRSVDVGAVAGGGQGRSARRDRGQRRHGLGRRTRARHPGMSAFVLEDGVVYHTYSAYARGLDGLWGMYQWLDRAPRGRNETAASGSAATTSTRARSTRTGSTSGRVRVLGDLRFYRVNGQTGRPRLRRRRPRDSAP